MHVLLINRILLILPIIDVLVGLVSLKLGLYSGYSMSAKLVTLLPSMCLRLALLILVLSSLEIKYSSMILFFVSFMFATELRAVILFGTSFNDVFVSIVHISKISTFIIFSLVIFQKKLRSLIRADKVLTFTIIVYTAGILLGTLSGDYYTTYGGQGSSGWLIKGSANSLGIIYLLASVPAFLYLKEHRSIFMSYLIAALILISSFLLLTKASIFSSLICFTIFVWQNLKSRMAKISFYFFLIVLLNSAYDLISQINISKRLSSVYEYYDGSILKVLLSGRHLHAEAAFEIFQSFSFMSIIFGLGHQNFRNNMEPFIGKVIGVEIDYLDIFFMNGLFIFSTYLVLLVLFATIIYRSGVHARFVHVSLYLLALILAFISGHVLFSGIAGHIIPLFVIYCMNQKVKNKP